MAPSVQTGKYGGSNTTDTTTIGYCVILFISEAYVELPIAQFSLVSLSYQPPLNPSIRSYVIYRLTISTTLHFSSHNRCY